MKYHICIEAEAAGAIAEREDPTSESVGYLVEDTFEADNIEEATKIAKEWTAKRILRLEEMLRGLPPTGKPRTKSGKQKCESIP